MIDQIGKHGLVDIDLKANGDLHIDDHHTIEDIGICFGEALKEAIGEKRGIRRYGFSYIPLDEALSRVVLDFSGRPGLFLDVKYAKDTVGNIDVDLFEHFFQSICNHGFLTLHITNFSGDNTHHQVETIFKAFGKALRMAIEVDTKSGENIPSTKGSL
jgi:Imidazoleglycerol-phosphate dehydratase